MAKGRNNTGVSMCGGIINTNKLKPIPCNCMQCYHKRTINNIKFCTYYQKEIDKNRKTCPRYYGKKVYDKRPKKIVKNCKNCKDYNLKERFCNSFNIDIGSTLTGRYCKKFNQK